MNKSDLWKKIIQIWQGTEVDFVQKLISSMFAYVARLSRPRETMQLGRQKFRCCKRDSKCFTFSILIISFVFAKCL